MRRWLVKIIKILLHWLEPETKLPSKLNYRRATEVILSQTNSGRRVFLSILMDEMTLKQVEEVFTLSKTKKHYKRREELRNILEQNKRNEKR
jgi:uncharacterized lipoprotein